MKKILKALLIVIIVVFEENVLNAQDCISCNGSSVSSQASTPVRCLLQTEACRCAAALLLICSLFSLPFLIKLCRSTFYCSLTKFNLHSLGIHPCVLHTQMYLRSLGIRPMLFSHFFILNIEQP